ncbi:MAG: glycosyltransferase family 4 protein [Halanaerobium sp.]|nr:glycosyltransferase family 4 protein [Halanaerobium sp.]
MAEKSKVLHIITRMINGGADENTLFTVNGLARDNYQVALLVGEEHERKMMQRLEDDVQLYILASLVRDISPVNDLRALLFIYRLIKKEKYEIVHTHTAKAGVLGRVAARMAGVPAIIHTIHGTTFPDTISFPQRFIYKNLERFCGWFTDFFITVGEDMQEKYLQAGIGSPDRYQTVYSGMELAKFNHAAGLPPARVSSLKEELGIAPEEIVVGNVARLEARKGQKFYFQVAARVCEEVGNVRFLVVGDGADREKLQQQAGELGLEDRVVFTGYRDDVEDIFAIIDIKILTSLWEGLPRVLIQAAAVGRPVVTFAVDGVHEIVREGYNGYIVPIRDVGAMAERVIRLVQDRDLREKMGRQARQLVGDRWTIKRMVTDTGLIYQGMLQP